MLAKTTLQAPSTDPASVPIPSKLQRGVKAFRRLWRKAPSAVVCMTFVLVVILLGALAPIVAPFDPVEQNILSRFQLPNSTHWLGTDNLGRDIFSRIVWGSRSILGIGIGSIVLALVGGVPMGVLAGFYRGKVDELLMRITDLLLSFPVILLALLVIAVLGPKTTNAIVAIGVSTMPVFARLARSLTLQVSNTLYVEAARSLGATDWRILTSHILPNLIDPIIVQASANLAMAIGYASALNFIGLGVQPPTPDWGVMVADGKQFIFNYPHVSFFPGLFITLTVVCLNFVGDGLRDWLDPKDR